MRVVNAELLELAFEARRRFAPESQCMGESFREWLLSGGTYFVHSSSRNKLIIESVDDSWARASGVDTDRFFWAARESIVPRTAHIYDPRSIGWTSVAAYYSGFYLLLGFLRVFGYGLMYITTADATLIAAAPGTIAALDKGIYSLRVTLSHRSQIELSKQSSRGFHEGFWQYADKSLELIAEEISRGEGVGRAFSSQLRSAALLSVEDLRQWLGTSENSNRGIGWMSGLRNEINYQLKRSVWAPNLRNDGVAVDRLRQDVLGILKGTRERLGAQLQIDRDVRAMIERVSILFRDIAPLGRLPALG
jgi:hypothetical protein